MAEDANFLNVLDKQIERLTNHRDAIKANRQRPVWWSTIGAIACRHGQVTLYYQGLYTTKELAGKYCQSAAVVMRDPSTIQSTPNSDEYAFVDEPRDRAPQIVLRRAGCNACYDTD
jgi:hypothetical protein